MDCKATFGDGSINGVGGGQPPIKSPAEGDCGDIANGELHRHDGRNAGAEECRRYAGIGASRAGTGRQTCIQED